jgi:hypothetical protein
MLGLSSVFTIKHFNINKLILKLGLFDTRNYDLVTYYTYLLELFGFWTLLLNRFSMK